VEKHLNDEAFAGANVRQGEMDAVVTGTGMHTFFGQTARLVEEAKTVSHFQKAVVKIGNYLIVLAVALVAVILLIALFRHENMVQVVQFALVLTVAAIPVALPPVLSVTLAVGAVALARQQAIVSKLVAIEEMAGMDILCSDKTGTITKNELTWPRWFPGVTSLRIKCCSSRLWPPGPRTRTPLTRLSSANSPLKRLRP
jgi:H+-transporting ATPase